MKASFSSRLPSSFLSFFITVVLSLIIYPSGVHCFERCLHQHSGRRHVPLVRPKIALLSSSSIPASRSTGRYAATVDTTDGTGPFNDQANTSNDEFGGVNPKRTCYDILGVTQDAPREVIKQRYITLAREYHPDAQIGKPDHEKIPEQFFSEIASAWKILSNKRDRMRYDRSLQATALANDISAFVSTMGQQAGPPARRIFEELAVPFLRRSAATTVASFTAVSNNLKNGTNVSLGNAVVSAIQAGQIASNVVDSIELLEQAEDLERRAVIEMENAAKAKAELSVVTEMRLFLTLRTPNSDISSNDALKILDGFNTLDSLSLIERAMWKQPLEHGVRELEEAETEFQIKRDIQRQNQQMYQDLINNQKREEVNARLALEAEERARKAYEAAQRLVLETKQVLAETTKALSTAEVAAKRSTNELDRVSLNLSRRQERLRRALRKKEESVREKQLLEEQEEEAARNRHQDVQVDLTPLMNLACDGDDEELCVADIEEYRKEERRLSRESAHLEEKANRMQMRATRLREKAEMKRQQYTNEDNANKN